MLPPLASAANRAPALFRASPAGKDNPEAKVLCAPPGVNLTMLPLPGNDANRSPALLKASPSAQDDPEAKVLCAPPGVNSKMLLAQAFPANRFCACALEEIRMAAPAQITPPEKLQMARMGGLNFVFISLLFLKANCQR